MLVVESSIEQRNYKEAIQYFGQLELIRLEI